MKQSFPMSQHFIMSEGEGANSNFNWSYRSTADSDDDNDDKAEENEVGDVGGEGRGNTDRRNFWSHAEDEVLVRAWLEVSKDKKTNTNQKGNEFWAKVEAMFNNVRLFRERQFEQGTEEIKKDDLLRVRALEPLRCRWKRLSANCSKFSGAYAHAASRRGSGHSDDDVIKIARRIYRDDKTRKNTSRVFQDMHAWDILKNEQIWAKNEDPVETCKQKTATQSSVSKRSRINEAGNYSSSTNPDTPTSGDAGCSGFPSIDDCTKNKGKNKVMNMETENSQQWLLTIQNMNITRKSETEMEMMKLRFQREKEAENAQLEREREVRKQRKINLELFKILEAKPYLSEEDQERRNNLVKILFPSN
ncbi:glutathione S-transferase T3-like [Chenopodium quinoa]|uniref:glutathione S-transferase T3-like n=1 Tax=Chenopodium quinoa TaxID=63459 RepID=UPI000B77B4AD|nr:glutathione S-transferase T3-like [Chenopodium quinoa]